MYSILDWIWLYSMLSSPFRFSFHKGAYFRFTVNDCSTSVYPIFPHPLMDKGPPWDYPWPDVYSVLSSALMLRWHLSHLTDAIMASCGMVFALCSSQHSHTTFVVPCKWRFTSCNNVLSNLKKFDMQVKKEEKYGHFLKRVSFWAHEAHKKLL